MGKYFKKTIDELRSKFETSEKQQNYSIPVKRQKINSRKSSGLQFYVRYYFPQMDV